MKTSVATILTAWMLDFPDHSGELDIGLFLKLDSFDSI